MSLPSLVTYPIQNTRFIWQKFYGTMLFLEENRLQFTPRFPHQTPIQEYTNTMPKRIYVGNLPFDLPKKDVENAFAKYGPVESVNMDKDRPGQASVNMSNTPDAQKAVQALNNSVLGGKSMEVKLG